MFGYIGKMLFVDLTESKIETRELTEEMAKNFVGGAGLGAKILYDEMPAKADVFGNKSMIGFISGPLNSNGAFFGGRYSVVSKSPVNGRWNDANSGGYFGPGLKRAGFDAVFVKGIAPHPVYIFIDAGNAEIRDAGHLWGLTISETEKALAEDIQTPKFIDAAMIGPAGENLSLMSAVMNDGHRAAARGGSGAVMGSKKLKAIVVRGNVKTEVADKKALVGISKMISATMKGPAKQGVDLYNTFGTGVGVEGSAVGGDSSVKNWKGAGEIDYSEADAAQIGSLQNNAKYNIGKYGCSTCPLKCGAFYAMEDGKWPLKHAGRPEYETTAAFGSALLCKDINAVVKCNDLCNEYGFDTISAGGTIAWAMECFENGALTAADLDGISLNWGDADAIVTILEKMCKNEGCGKWLKDGSRAASAHIGKGSEALVVVDGIEEAQHDSRYMPGFTRTYQYDPTPARHTKGGLGYASAAIRTGSPDRFKCTGFLDSTETSDAEVESAAGFCQLNKFALLPRDRIKCLSAVTGFQYTRAEEHFLGLRIFTLKHAFNLREGFKKEERALSDRFTKGPAQGPLAGIDIDSELLAENFFNAIGWNLECMPSRDSLVMIGGLDHVIADLYPPETEA